MDALRILQVVDAWTWFAEAEQALQATRALLARGHRVEVACQPSSPMTDRARTLGLPVHPLPGLRSPRWPTTPLLNVRRLAGVIDRVRPDLVHAYRSPPHVLAVSAARLSRHRPPVVRTRGGAQSIRRGPLNRRLYDRWTEITFVTSRRIHDDLVQAGFDSGRLVAVPNVVDVEALGTGDGRAFRVEQGLPESAPVVGVIGRLARVKGHRELVAALPALAAAHPDLVVCFVGPEADGSHLEVERLADSLGVRERTRWLGPVVDVAAAMSACDVIAVPSVGSEVIARVPLEAMALGRPLVVTTVGVLPEVTEHERTALQVAPGDPAALSAAIDRLLCDRGLGRRLGEAAASRVRERHLPEHLGAVLESTYRRMLGR